MSWVRAQKRTTGKSARKLAAAQRPVSTTATSERVETRTVGWLRRGRKSGVVCSRPESAEEECGEDCATGLGSSEKETMAVVASMLEMKTRSSSPARARGGEFLRPRCWAFGRA